MAASNAENPESQPVKLVLLLGFLMLVSRSKSRVLLGHWKLKENILDSLCMETQNQQLPHNLEVLLSYLLALVQPVTAAVIGSKRQI